MLDAHPRLTREDIRAAIAYASDTVAHEETVLVGNGTEACHLVMDVFPCR